MRLAAGLQLGQMWPLTCSFVVSIRQEIAYSARAPADELAGLANAIEDKVLHQLRGPRSNAERLANACAGLPNEDHLTRLIGRMTEGGTSEELLPLL